MQRDPDTGKVHGYSCLKCGAYVEKAVSDRGRLANKRGRRASGRIAKQTGGENREVEGKSFDVTNGMYAVQSKKGDSYWPKRIWDWLSAIAAPEGLTPALVIKDSPGPGRKERGIVVLEYNDWLDITGVKA